MSEALMSSCFQWQNDPTVLNNNLAIYNWHPHCKLAYQTLAFLLNTPFSKLGSCKKSNFSRTSSSSVPELLTWTVYCRRLSFENFLGIPNYGWRKCYVHFIVFFTETLHADPVQFMLFSYYTRQSLTSTQWNRACLPPRPPSTSQQFIFLISYE